MYAHLEKEPSGGMSLTCEQSKTTEWLRDSGKRHWLGLGQAVLDLTQN